MSPVERTAELGLATVVYFWRRVRRATRQAAVRLRLQIEGGVARIEIIVSATTCSFNLCTSFQNQILPVGGLCQIIGLKHATSHLY